MNLYYMLPCDHSNSACSRQTLIWTVFTQAPSVVFAGHDPWARLDKITTELLRLDTREHMLRLLYNLPSIFSPSFLPPLLTWSIILSLHRNTQTRCPSCTHTTTQTQIHTHANVNPYWHCTKWANVSTCQTLLSLPRAFWCPCDWPELIHTPVYMLTHTQISRFKHTVCFTCSGLSCLAGIISSYGAKGSKVTTAWQHKLHVSPFILVMRVSVLSKWHRDLFDQLFYPGVLFFSLYAHYKILCLHVIHCSLFFQLSSSLACIPASSFFFFPLSDSSLPQPS